MVIDRINITKEMKLIAKDEVKKRDKYIKHHFEVKHFTSYQRDEVGFLGEFACAEFLGVDWKKNIRKDYKKIDQFDFLINGKSIDVKTETLPVKYAKKILRKEISDNELYGRRLINKGQFNLLKKYDIVIFSLFAREHLDYWFPIGYIETKHIIKNYYPTINRPDGGKYTFSASAIPTSILKPVTDIKINTL